MFISKIKGKESGILLYGITPPKAQTAPEKVAEIAERCSKNIQSLDIDALVVYDVQDESARTNEERPFPFTSALDPFDYTKNFLRAVRVPKIIYRPAGKFTKEELTDWMQGLQQHGFYPVFVGLPSPDFVVKTSLKEAYAIWRENHAHESVIGAVTIPERHMVLHDEDTRILDKVSSGVSFFVSQCIFNVAYSKKMLQDLLATCSKNDQPIPTIIFTLTICGSVKTLHFMEWLGIHIPDDIKENLKTCTDPTALSKEIAVAIAKELISYCGENKIPFGFNIESVATRKEEVAAAMDLLHTVSALLQEAGLRKSVKKATTVLAD